MPWTGATFCRYHGISDNSSLLDYHIAGMHYSVYKITTTALEIQSRLLYHPYLSNLQLRRNPTRLTAAISFPSRHKATHMSSRLTETMARLSSNWHTIIKTPCYPQRLQCLSTRPRQSLTSWTHSSLTARAPRRYTDAEALNEAAAETQQYCSEHRESGEQRPEKEVITSRHHNECGSAEIPRAEALHEIKEHDVRYTHPLKLQALLCPANISQTTGTLY